MVLIYIYIYIYIMDQGNRLDRENRFTFNLSTMDFPRINNYPGDGSKIYKKLIKNHIYAIRCRGAGFFAGDLIVRYTPSWTDSYLFKILWTRHQRFGPKDDPNIPYNTWVKRDMYGPDLAGRSYSIPLDTIEQMINANDYAFQIYDLGSLGQKISETVSPDQVAEAENFGVDVALPVTIKKGKTNPYIATKILNYLHGVDDPNNPKNKQVIDNIYRNIWPKPVIPREFRPGYSDPKKYLTDETSWIWRKALGRDELEDNTSGSSSDIQAKEGPHYTPKYSVMDRAKGLFGYNSGGKKSRKSRKSKKSRKSRKSKKSRKN